MIGPSLLPKNTMISSTDIRFNPDHNPYRACMNCMLLRNMYGSRSVPMKCVVGHYSDIDVMNEAETSRERICWTQRSGAWQKTLDFSRCESRRSASALLYLTPSCDYLVLLCRSVIRTGMLTTFVPETTARFRDMRRMRRARDAGHIGKLDLDFLNQISF